MTAKCFKVRQLASFNDPSALLVSTLSRTLHEVMLLPSEYSVALYASHLPRIQVYFPSARMDHIPD